MKPTRYFSKKQEKDVANKLGAKVVPNSGATFYRKGDCSIGSAMENCQWLIECKTCMENKQSFSIKKDWLEKLQEEKIGQGKFNCALAFNFGPNQQNYYIIDEKTFKSFLDMERE